MGGWLDALVVDIVFVPLPSTRQRGPVNPRFYACGSNNAYLSRRHHILGRITHYYGLLDPLLSSFGIALMSSGGA